MATQADLDRLKRAYASGVLRVSYDGQTVEYRSLTDLAIAIATIESELNAAAGIADSRQLRSVVSKGT